LDAFTSKKAGNSKTNEVSKKEENTKLDLEANKINLDGDSTKETKIAKTKVEEVNEVQKTQKDEEDNFCNLGENEILDVESREEV